MRKKRKFLLINVVEEEVAVVAGAVCHSLMSVYITINYILHIQFIIHIKESCFHRLRSNTMTKLPIIRHLNVYF